jgi:hypothetical protein
MTGNWKSWLASASILLLVGAGCAGYGDQSTGLDEGADIKTAVEDAKDASLDASADAALDAALREVDASTNAELKENSDAEIVTNDSTELNSYGKSYDQNEL